MALVLISFSVSNGKQRYRVLGYSRAEGTLSAQTWQGAEILLLLNNSRTLKSYRIWMKAITTDLSAWSDEPDTRGKFLPFLVPLHQWWNCCACVSVGGLVRFPERSRRDVKPTERSGCIPGALAGQQRILCTSKTPHHNKQTRKSAAPGSDAASCTTPVRWRLQTCTSISPI